MEITREFSTNGPSPQPSPPGTRERENFKNSLPLQLISQLARIINFSQRFDDRAGMDGNRSCFVVSVCKIERERLDVPIEDNAHQFPGAVDHGAAGIASDDVGGADKIEGRRQIEPGFVRRPAFRELEGEGVAVSVGMFKRAADRGEGGDLFSLFLVPKN